MKFKLIIILWFITAFLPCTGQSYYKTIGDSASDNVLSGVFKLQQGGFISYGRLYVSSVNNRRAVICKTDNSGNLVWQKYLQFGTAVFNTLTAGLELPTGELMFFSQFQNTSNNSELLSIKTDSSGNLLWAKKYSTNSVNVRVIYDAVVSLDNNILLAATIGSFSALYAQQTVYKLDTAGNILWNKGFRMQNGGDDYLEQILEGPDHCIYMRGDRTFSVGGQGHPTISKMDSVGNVLWSRHYSLNNPSPRPVFRDMSMLPSGNLLICGSTYPLGAVAPFSFLFELDTSGAVVWQQNFNTGNISLDAFSLVVDSLQRIHLQGTYSYLPNELFNLVTDSSGTIYSSWRAAGNFTPATIVSTTTNQPTGFFAGSITYGMYYKWALIQLDSVPSLCGTQPLNAALFPQAYFTSNSASLTVNPNNLTMANAAFTQGNISIIGDGCMLTGVDEPVATKTISVFPNPAIDQIRFELPVNINSLMIADAYGKIIYQDHSFNGNAFDFNCNQLPTGIYFIVLNGEKSSLFKSSFVVSR